MATATSNAMKPIGNSHNRLNHRLRPIRTTSTVASPGFSCSASSAPLIMAMSV